MSDVDSPPPDHADHPETVESLARREQTAGSSLEWLDMDPKIQAILMGLLHAYVIHLQRETNTSIYMSRQLAGVLDSANGIPNNTGYHHLALPKAPPHPHGTARPQMPPYQPQPNGYGHPGPNAILPQMTGSSMVPNPPTTPWQMNQTHPHGHHSHVAPPPHLQHSRPQYPRPMQHRPDLQPSPTTPTYPPPPYHPSISPHPPMRPMDHHPDALHAPRPNGYQGWSGHDHGSVQGPPQSLTRAPSVPPMIMAPPRPMNGYHYPAPFPGPRPPINQGPTNGDAYPSAHFDGPRPPAQFHGPPRGSVDGQHTPPFFPPNPNAMSHPLPQRPFTPPPPHGWHSRPPFPGPPGQYHAHQSHNYYGHQTGPMPPGPSNGFGVLGGPGGAPSFNRSPIVPPPRQSKIKDLAIEQPAIDRFAGRHPGLGSTGGEQGDPLAAWRIWICGPIEGVQKAKQMLLDAAASREFSIISRDLAMQPRRLEWVTRHHLDDVKKIMVDNATYIQVPVIGSQSGIVTVFGDHHIRIERSLRSFARIASRFYEAMIWLVPDDPAVPVAEISSDDMRILAAKVAQGTGAWITYRASSFDLYGTDQQVRMACQQILGNESLAMQKTKVSFRFQLAKEFQLFYGGTGFGKMNKIIKAHGVHIQFKPASDYNFLIEISGSGQHTVDAFISALGELPAQLSLHIPEGYHRMIIGDRGSSIQVIMGRYQCFVKCCNAEEHALLGGYDENEDNVQIYLPARNRSNLQLAKQDLMQLVDLEDRNYTSRPVRVERKHHQLLSQDRWMYVQDQARRTRTDVRFPFKETGSDVVTVHGPKVGIDAMTRILLGLLPLDAEIFMPVGNLVEVVASPEYDCFRQKVKALHSVDIGLGPHFGLGAQASFILRGNQDKVPLAREALQKCLQEHEFVTHVGSPRAQVNEFEQDIVHPIPDPNPYGPSANEPRRQDLKALFQTEGTAPSGNALGFASPLDMPNSERLPASWQRSQVPPPQNGDRVGTSKRDSDPIIRTRMNGGVISRLPRGSASRAQSLDVSHTTPRKLWGPQESGLPLNLDAALGSSSIDIASLRPHTTGEGKSDVDGITRGLYESRF